VGPTNLDKLSQRGPSSAPHCLLPLKSAEVRFNPARWWCVPLQLARVEDPSDASCDFGPARPQVRRRVIDADSHRLQPEMPGSEIHRCQTNISAQVSALSSGNLRRQRTPTEVGCPFRSAAGAASSPAELHRLYLDPALPIRVIAEGQHTCDRTRSGDGC
jgi:hypothetical protein